VSLSHQAQQATQGRAANQDTQTRSTRQELKNRSGWDSVHDELLTEVWLRLLMIELFFLEVSFLKFNFDLAIEEHCPRRSTGRQLHLEFSARRWQHAGALSQTEDQNLPILGKLPQGTTSR
jgi:hypothetical protein